MIKPLLFVVLAVLSDNFIVSALEDTTENGIISYDKDSVDLIVNIALSLFDSLQDYTKHINETEEKIKVKFKPKLIIEEVDTDPHFEHGELLFLEDEPELREISYEDEDRSRNEISGKDYTEVNLNNHRKDALNESEARKIAIKMALDDNKNQDNLMNIINQSLINKEDAIFANQQENEIVIDDETENNKFKFHKEFPNIYSQSDSVFEIGNEVEQNIKLNNKQDKMNIQIEEQDVADVSNIDNKSSERRSDEASLEEEVNELAENKEPRSQSNLLGPHDIQDMKQKQKRRRKRRKRPFDGRENWEKLNKAIFGDANNLSPPSKEAQITSKDQENVDEPKKSKETDIGGKRKRRRKRKKGVKRKPQDRKRAAIQPKQSLNLKQGKSKINFLKSPTIHLTRPVHGPMPKIQLRGRPLNLRSFLNIF